MVQSFHCAQTLAPRLRVQDAEYTLAIMQAVVQAVAGGPIRPLWVRVQHPLGTRERELRQHFGCPVLSGGADNAIRYEASLMALPVRGADPKLLTVLTDYVERELEGLPPQEDGLARVLWAIRRALAAGPTLGGVARHCRLGARTLQRRLADHGWSFSGLVDEIRREIYEELRDAGRHDGSAIAEALGFCDASALAKARRRWASSGRGIRSAVAPPSAPARVKAKPPHRPSS